MTKKRILCLLLSALLLFPSLVLSFTEVSAAEEEKVTMIVARHKILESGRSFYLGDMIDIRLKTERFSDRAMDRMEPDIYFWSATEIGASYTSDHPEVLSVQEESGYAETKEPGTANVTFQCRNMTISFPVTVVAKGTLCEDKEELADKWDAAGKALAAVIPEELTPENGYELIRALKTYLTAFRTDAGADPQTAYESLSGWDPDEEESRIAPACSCFRRVESLIKHYIAQYHPLYDEKYRFSRSLYRKSAKTNQITFQFKKKITKEALLALYLGEIVYALESEEASLPFAINTKIQKGRLEARSYICAYNIYKCTDIKNSGQYAVMVFKQGSDTAAITHTYRTLQNPKTGVLKLYGKKKLKLKKKKYYRLYINTMDIDGSNKNDHLTIKAK